MNANDLLKSMLQDLINDRTESAEMNVHDYIVAKTQTITNPPVAVDDNDEGASE
jgi:hypothetical protein